MFITNLGVLIKFEVGSWLKKNNRLYEQGAVRPINLGGGGGGVWGHAPPENFEIWRLWNAISGILDTKLSRKHVWKLQSLHGLSMWNKVKKNIPASTAILGTVQTTLLTKREGWICTRKRPVAFLIFHPFQYLFSFLANPQFSGKTF